MAFDAFELGMNLLGLGISAFIGRFAYAGYSAIASPNLLRLTFAFISIAIGFVLLSAASFVQAADYSRGIATTGLGVQAVGYFFIAFSHSVKSFDFAPPKYFAFLLPFALTPFVIPGNSIEHLVRSISFILLVYVSIETMASYMQNRRTSTLMIGSGLGMLALAEIMAWYSFVYPGAFFYVAIAIKVIGFGLLFVPFSKFGLAGGLGGRFSRIGGRV
ncbi:MAG TPA: hypothetical protein VJP79_02080 [Nitrososphaera sp.]|nr:hypothetical protein [Nitrososphaera sp.]